MIDVPAVALCFSGLGDSFYMSLILRHLKKVYPFYKTTLILHTKYSGLFSDGVGGIDHYIFRNPPLNPVAYFKEISEQYGSKVYYYDLYRKRPDLIPWKGQWKGNAIFDRYMNLMPDPDLKKLKTRDYIPIAETSQEILNKTRKIFPKTRPRIIMEYQPHSFYPPINRDKYLNLVKVLESADYECLWLAGADHPGFPAGTDGRGVSFGTARALMIDSDAFIGIGSGLSCLACTVPDVYKLEIQNSGIYCFKTVFPLSLNHEVLDSRSEDLEQSTLNKLRSKLQ